MLHLAWHFQRADVDAFLDELTQEQLNEWRAYREFVGTDDWRQIGRLSQLVYSIGAGMAGEKTPELDKFTDTLSEAIETEDPLSKLAQRLRQDYGNTRQPSG